MNIKELLKKYGIAEDKITEATSEFQTAVEAELDTRGLIPKSRFQETYREKKDLEGKLAEYEVKIENLEAQVNSHKESVSKLNALQTELDGYKNKSLNEKKEAWKKHAEFFNVDDKHKDKDRILKLKARFTFPEEGKELDEAQLSKNIEMFELLKDTGAISFESNPANPPRPTEPGGGKPNTGKSMSMLDYIEKTTEFKTK